MKKQFLAVVFIFASCVSVLAAGDPPVIDESNYLNPLVTGVPSLSIAPDAVAGGMGDIGVATLPDIHSQHWNASKYPFANSSAGFAISYTPWLRRLGVSDIDLAYLSGYYNISKIAGTVSASLRFFSLGEIQLRENADQVQTISVKPYELAFDAGYSRMLSEHFSMGVAFRFIVSDLSARSEDYFPGYSFSADINGYYALPIDIKTGESKLGLGFNLSNLGTKISYDKNETSNFLPTNMRFGLSYLVPFDKFNRLAINADINKLLIPSRKSKFTEGFNPDDPSTWTMSEKQYSAIGVMKGLGYSFCDAPGGFKEEMQEIMWALGLEYAYNEQFFGRAGYFNESQNKGNRKYFTFGAGFRLSAFKLDVGYVVSLAQNNPLDQTLRFTLSFDVDGIKALADRGKDK
jgi:hypothetical protein